MVTLTGPDFVALQVRDLAASARFYQETVGLPVNPDGPPHAVVFDTSPIPFAVREPLVDLDAASRLGWGVALWFACDDADALYARLGAAGVTIAQPPADGAFGRQFTFVDPDGYAVTVHDSRPPEEDGDRPQPRHVGGAETRIAPDQHLVTLINVFVVQPERQQRLIEVLLEGTAAVMRHQPGFVSANIHRGLDGRRVTNYAQWRRRQDFEAMLQNPEAQDHMRQAAEIADSFEPYLYDVAFTDSVAGE